MKVLIVVDMQNDFVTGSLANPEAEKIIPRIKEKIESGNYDSVIFTQDTHNKRYFDTLEGKKLPICHCRFNTSGWEFVPELEPYCDNSIMKDSFGYKYWYDTLIDYLIFDEELEKIELCGTCTDICVISNALILRAEFPDVPIYVDANACAGSTKENHEAALKVMKSCQIDIIGE